MRICFWSTSFQADNQALACALAEREDLEVVVALDDPQRYRDSPVERWLPFRGRMIDRRSMRAWFQIADFRPDVLVVDNHLPPYPPPRMLVLWHGYGWKMDDISGMRRELARLVGDPTRPNPRLRWNAFGPDDARYTAEHRHIDPQNLWRLGSPFADLVRPDSALRQTFDPAAVAKAYPDLDVARRPTVLLGMTWHHGSLFGHWGDEWQLLEALFAHLEARGVGAIFRLHDRHRYPGEYLERLARLCRAHPGTVHLKFKSEAPDSLIDILVSDVLVTNYSSFANAWYHTARPSVHVAPPDVGSGLTLRSLTRRGVDERAVEHPGDFWKLDPGDVGGLRAPDFPSLLTALDRALDEPDCCATLAADFVERHIAHADGTSTQHLARALERWLEHAP